MPNNAPFLEAVDDPEVAKYLTYALRHIEKVATELASVEVYLEALRGFPGIVDIMDVNDSLQGSAAAIQFRLGQTVSNPGISTLSKAQLEESRKVFS
ncbi:MAG: hypothetical protein JRN62_03210 [Nitrososphaerota archaeon]|jgi:hypothetical protein|nr:hypothetical protein [Nitrososphaerota archaeon]MDG6948606.1 hypothetical protein [Nitrososphaerota archaeon]